MCDGCICFVGRKEDTQKYLIGITRENKFLNAAEELGELG
jgi:hypothetical protein